MGGRTLIQYIRNQNKSDVVKMLSRNVDDSNEASLVAKAIIEDVKARGDIAVNAYTKKFDGATIDDLQVSQSEIDEAMQVVSVDLKEALQEAANNIRKYHEQQGSNSYFINEKDYRLGQIVKPIANVGMYVPGGRAAYPSTVLMTAIPAKIAGVKELVMITPPKADGTIQPSLLVAAAFAGVDKIYKVGGAQGIAALTYGTETISKVAKIVGPGNSYVAAAKKIVSSVVGIDMVAGPSEIAIIADKEANPAFIAADLMSQAEHDEDAAAILLTDSEALAEAVKMELAKQVEQLSRKSIILEALSKNGAIVITNSIDEAIDITNELAPEHLEILTTNAVDVYGRIESAGAIFIGEYSPEPVGDYFAGPNHTLPTNGTAKFASPLSVTDFQKKTSLVYYSKEALEMRKDAIELIAEEEGLTAHANAISIRFKR
ncbi:histidinol dehydrogenase [Lottiidibacillus patelloidae]|uniref:Histidinol dehydrogenase n=2 Tax=Lottiidibacillus patelloidae TaxID=2670334 RepID=A0A263BTE6_9BACI|nr:histidinol dehydrogenase [Lottiidibacillus patelloidae]